MNTYQFIKKTCLCFFILIVGGGCSSSQVSNEKKKEENKNTAIANVTTDQIAQKDLSYHFDTDAQCDLGDYTDYAYTKNGYYHMKLLNQENDNMTYQLTFTDKKSGKTVPVCTKSNCTHTSADCDANFEEGYDGDHASANKSYYIGYGYFQYYKGSLYLPVKKGDYVYLMKVGADGSTRSNVMKLCRFLQITKKKGDATETESFYPMLQIHRGYVYFTNDETGGKTATLYRKKMGGDQIETIKHLKSHQPMIYRIHPYGNYVFYIAGTMDSKGNMKSNLYAYNTKNKKIFLAGKNISGNYTVYKGSIYYTNGFKTMRIYRLSLGSFQPTYITKTAMKEGESVHLYGNGKKVVVQFVNNDGNLDKQMILENTKKVSTYKTPKIKPYQNL